jgi:hypothetical protein
MLAVDLAPAGAEFTARTVPRRAGTEFQDPSAPADQ